MTPADLALRRETYRMLVAAGRVPTAAELSDVSGLPTAQVREGWQRLHAEHALVLDAAGTEIRMANPFSAVPTRYRVEAAGRWWYANCAWDAFGVCAALHVDGTIETSCADCDAPLRIDVRDEQPQDTELLFHCLVPAVHWWDDIVFT